MLGKVLATISVDKVQLNTICRPPLLSEAKGVEEGRIHSIARFLGEKCEVIPAFGEEAAPGTGRGFASRLLATLRRRSLSFDDIVRVTGVSPSRVRTGLARLERQKKIRAVPLDEATFYVAEDEGESS